MKEHTLKECRANIEIVTPNTAICSICGQSYKRSFNYGKAGWQRKEGDNRFLEYIRVTKV